MFSKICYLTFRTLILHAYNWLELWKSVVIRYSSDWRSIVVLNTLESCNLRRTQICTQFEIINLISLDTLYKYSIQKIIRLLSHISLYLPLNFPRPVKWSRLSVICLHVKLATLGLDHIIFDLWGMLAFKRRSQAIEATITVAKY